MTPVIEKMIAYTESVTALKVQMHHLKEKDSFDESLKSVYNFYDTSIDKTRVVTAALKSPAERYPKMILRDFARITESTGAPAVLLLENIRSDYRYRLIELKIPFIVPGNQMYLPDLLIDLREHFTRARKVVKNLSPAAQTVLLYLIIKNEKGPLNGGALAGLMGFSRMTISRVFDELENLKLAVVKNSGKERLLTVTLGKKELWEKSLPFMTDPVKKSFFVGKLHDSFKSKMLISGQRAVERHTIFVPNKLPVYAIGYEHYKLLSKNHPPVKVHYEDEAVARLEVWKYQPSILTNGDSKTVDLLSLYVHFRLSKEKKSELALEVLIRSILR